MGIFSGLKNMFDGSSQQKDANKMAMQSWNMANDFNSPVRQMERLKAAGLNPNLVYGSGSVAGNTTSAPALQGGGISTGAETLMNVGSKTIGMLQGVAALDQTKASTQASVAAAGASGAQAANLNAQAAINDVKAKYEQKAQIADIDYKTALAKKTNAEASIAQGEADLFGSAGGAKGAQAIGKGASTALRIGRSLFGR